MLGTRMSLIEIMENKQIKEYQENSHNLLSLEKTLVEYHYSWLTLILTKTEILGKGNLIVGDEKYEILLRYSPFLPVRFDRIYIGNKDIQYHPSIHMYGDTSLCLYHPILDKPLLKLIPLLKMIPWITEWCVHYSEWKKYGVWLGREIKH